MGLKENVIVGRLIPAGTGGVLQRLKKLPIEEDRFAPPRDIEPPEMPLRSAGDDLPQRVIAGSGDGRGTRPVAAPAPARQV